MKTSGNTLNIFSREWKEYFESPIAYVFLVVFLMLLGFLTFFVSNFYETGQADLRPFFFWHPWVYLLLVPAVSMKLWAEERRTGTIELLLTLPITLTQTVLGKFLAGWLFLALGIGLTFPIVITTAYLGNPDMGAVWGGYLGCLMLAGTFLSVGILASALTRNQVISFVVALVACLFLVLAGWPPVTKMLVDWAPNWLVEGVSAISVMPHFESIQRGVLDLRDFVYYLSVIGLMLYATYLVLKYRKAT